MPKADHKNRTAFTLVELLVVIAVLGILIALAMPAIRKAWQSAATAECVSSLRQLHTATMHYANDHDGCLPLDYWMGAIGPYLEIPSYDPSVTERSGKFPICKAAMRRALSISKTTIDRYGHDNSRIRTHSMNDVLKDTNLVPTGLRLLGIPAPSKTALFLDGTPEGDSYPYWRAFVRGDAIPNIPGTFVHNGRLNVIFCDGHLECISESEMPRDVERSLFWNPLAEDPMVPNAVN
jgi:prepilin-type N-terminal cleavage/methylation domain-containing protein/prepilin-type processing-associated H-X9-DG protein